LKIETKIAIRTLSNMNIKIIHAVTNKKYAVNG